MIDTYEYDGIEFWINSRGSVIWLSDWLSCDRLIATGIFDERYIGAGYNVSDLRLTDYGRQCAQRKGVQP